MAQTKARGPARARRAATHTTPPPSAGASAASLNGAAVLALARQLASLFDADLMCRCGRAPIGDDGQCPACAEEAVWT